MQNSKQKLILLGGLFSLIAIGSFILMITSKDALETKVEKQAVSGEISDSRSDIQKDLAQNKLPHNRQQLINLVLAKIKSKTSSLVWQEPLSYGKNS